MQYENRCRDQVEFITGMQGFLNVCKSIEVIHHCSYNSVTTSCPTLCDPKYFSTSGFPVFHHLLEFAQLHVHWIGDDSKLFHPLMLSSPFFPSIRVFSTESALHITWPKNFNFWSFSFSISPSNEYSGFIFFEMDWFDLLAIQGTLKSLLQHHNLKALIIWCSAFFVVQLWHLYMTTGKNIAFTTWTFVRKVMSLLFNILSLS